MKLTRSEAETLLALVETEIRRLNSQKRSTKKAEKLYDKISHYLTLKGLPSK